MDLLIFFVVFVVLLAIGAPIYISLIIPSIVYVVLNPGLPMLLVMQRMLVSINSFPLMAVPLFIFAGAIMNKGSVTDRIFDFAKTLVGRYRGGLSYVNILASLIFSGMSGSALADVGGLGQVELKSMKDAGYDDSFAIGVTCASSTVGPIIPPSIPFVIFASYASVSTGALFMGGIIPGLLISLVLSVLCYFVSKQRNYPREAPSSFKEILISFKRSFLALLMPLIIIGGIWTGWFTATEAALVSIVYALAISRFVYRDLSLKKILEAMEESLRNVIPIMMIIVSVSLFCWVLTYEKLDQLVLNALVSFTSSKYVVILLICLLVTILGMFFDSTVSILLLVPILLPICMTYGINAIHLGVIIVLGNMIALLTPPVGMSLYVMASVTNKPVGEIVRYCAPWLIPLFATWLLVAFYEPLVMLIPNLMGLGSGL